MPSQTDWWKVLNEDDIPTPAVLLFPDRIRENLDRMIAWSGDPSRLRPHVKTHKLPQVIQMKLERGIRKFKTSTIAESEMVAMAGGKDILLAVQPVGQNLTRLFRLQELYPDVRFTTIVDDLDHLETMYQRAKTSSQLLRLFLDLNVGMNRTGTPLGSTAESIYVRLHELSQLAPETIELAGLHAYDGHLHEPDQETLSRQVNSTFDPVWDFCRSMQMRGIPVPKVVASGTPTSPMLVHNAEFPVEVSAGTTVLWDAGQPRTCPSFDFLHAAVLLTRVISRPTANRICLDLGHKAVASEFPQPRVLLFGLEDAEPVVHSEEHLVLETDRASDFPIGTPVYGIPYHVCPTIALHSHVWPIHQQLANTPWPVPARNRILTV